MVYYLEKSEKLYDNSCTIINKERLKNPKLRLILTNCGSEFLTVTLGDEFNK